MISFMKKSVFPVLIGLAAVCATTTVCPAQQSGPTRQQAPDRQGAPVQMVRLLPNWQVGDKMTYEMMRVRKRTRGNKVERNIQSRTRLDVEILDQNDKGYLVAWTTGKTEVDTASQETNVFLQKLSKLTEGFRVELMLDRTGELKGVRNWRQLKKNADGIIDTLTDKMKRAGMDPKAVAQIEQQSRAMTATKESLELIATREAKLLFFPLGKPYIVNQPEQYEVSLPNPLGGNPFPGAASITMTKLDRDRGTATITWSQEIDKEKGRDAMNKLLTDLAKRMGRQVKPSELPKSFAINDEAVFSVDLQTGWTTDMKHSRTVKAGPGAQVDRLSIRRVQ